MKTEIQSLRLVATCPDRKGIIGRVAEFISTQGANIVDASQYTEKRSDTFFMRYGFELPGPESAIKDFSDAFQLIADELEMDWHVTNVNQRRRVVMLVSKFDNCLAYLSSHSQFVKS